MTRARELETWGTVAVAVLLTFILVHVVAYHVIYVWPMEESLAIDAAMEACGPACW